MVAPATLLPNAEQQFIDGNGVPYALGKVYHYIPTTSTFKNTWQDVGRTVLNTNPIDLDGAGRAIIYGSGQYRQVLEDVDGNLIWDQLTQDVYGLVMSSDNVFTGTNTFEGEVFFNGGAIPIAAAGGTVDAITATYSPFPATLQNKALVAFISTGKNTIPNPTFKPNGLTTRTIVARGGGVLVDGDIGAAGFVGILEYNLANTRWELLNPAGAGSVLTGLTIAAGTVTATDTVLSAIEKLAAGGTGFAINVQSFPSSGTYTPDPDMFYCQIYTTGGGGGSAGGAGGNYGGGGGGGAGATIIGTFTSAAVGASQTITIGAGGTGGPPGTAGTAGGTTTVGTLTTAGGGGPGSPGGNGGAGGIGASTGTGGFLIQGGDGAGGGAVVSGFGAGGPGGLGGASFWGGGGINQQTFTIVDARTFGSGGGGGYGAVSPPGGGAGAPGVVYVVEYLTA